MRKFILRFSALLLSVMFIFCSCNSQQTQNSAECKNALKGLWISIYDLDYCKGNKLEFVKKFDSMMNTAELYGFNAVFVHVRSHGDANYDSSIYPWSAFITGTQGKAPDFDPLEVMIKLAHNHDLQFHAWINPFRVSGENKLDGLSADNPAKCWLNDADKSNDSCVIRRKDGIYYNPSSSAVRRLIVDGALEIARKYDVDGIHLDDYFYPCTDSEIDKNEYAAYKSGGGKDSIEDFRRECIDDMVSKLYSEIKSVNKKIQFGISPQANIETDMSSLYANVKKWGSKSGFVDYIAPQIYYGFNNSAVINGQKMNFENCFDLWKKTVDESKVKLYIGLGLYKSGKKDSYAKGGIDEWTENDDIISRQASISLNDEKCSGIIVFSFGSLSENDTSKKEADNLSKLLNNNEAAAYPLIATVTSKQARTLRGDYADDTSDINYTYLPQGTVDYCAVRDIVNNSGDSVRKYRKLRSGMRVYTDNGSGKSDVSIGTGKLPEYNSVDFCGVKNDSKRTILTFDEDFKAPFTVRLNSEDNFEYVDINFCYAKKVRGGDKFRNNPLFSSSQWVDAKNSRTLRLTLCNKGEFFGYHASYDDFGRLILSFLNPPKVSKSDNEYGISLKNQVIMVDAGHGGKDVGATSNNGKIHESVLNLKLAKALESELKKTGAKIIMTRNDNSEPRLSDRTEMIFDSQPDLFVSVHHDWSGNKNASGASTYYYYPFSKKLGSFVHNSSGKVMNKLKLKYYPFYVTRMTECPSILTENGFMSNDSEVSRLADDKFIAKQAKAIAKGIAEYYACYV